MSTVVATHVDMKKDSAISRWNDEYRWWKISCVSRRWNIVIKQNSGINTIVHALLQSERAIFHGLSSKRRRKATFAGRCAIISQRVAISRGPRGTPASRQFSRCCPLFADTFTKGTGWSPEASPRDYANESTQRGSADSRLRCCQAETTNRRHFLLPRRHGQTTRSARLPCYLVHVGGVARGWTQGSKYNRPKDMKNETEDRQGAIRQLRRATSQTRK